MKKIKLALAAIISISFIACQEDVESTTTAEEVVAQNGPYSKTINGITVYEADFTQTFDEAKLQLTDAPNPETDGVGNFSFNVSGYKLAVPTEDQLARGCAYSDKGQHIHFIMDNQPYKAFYTNSFEAEYPENGSNVMLAFLSRAYHESVKSKDAFVLKQFSVQDKSKELDYAAPHLFYSRPKGNYVGLENHDKVLLDFYLVNTDLKDKDYQVEATINGEVFMLPEWKAYFMTGLKVGANTVRLRLLDSEGNFVEGPFNDSGEREFALLEG